MPYATRADLVNLSISAKALSGITPERQDAALDAASRLADGYLNVKYRMPLVTYGTDLTQAVCDIAAFRLMKSRGFNPESADAEMMQESERQAIKWFEAIAAGKVQPVGIRDSAPTTVNATGPEETYQEQFVVQPSTGAEPAEDFWGTSGGIADGVGPSRRRGW